MGIEKANAVNTHLSGIWCCRLPSESVPGFVPMLCPFTLQRTNFCELGVQLQESFPFYFSTDRNLPFVEYAGEKIFSAGAGFSSGDFQNLAQR